jgi:hypothetical protein
MTPLDFLNEEFANVKDALAETLRYDYGPERSKDYYNECASRLAEIKKALPAISPIDSATIAAQMSQLGLLAGWISLIERSHLGEFSWPFADEIRRIAINLLSERNLKGDLLEPLIHVVSEGRGYRIVNERLVGTTSRRRFAVVAFPRPLKHHVLLHTIFGHELGHTALYTARLGAVLRRDVIGTLSSSGPLQNSNTMDGWLYDSAAPQEVKNELSRYAASTGSKFSFKDEFRTSWLVELTCDIFGLMLFGPAFLAAHRAILQPLYSTPFQLGLGMPTHPPYAVRHKMLARTLGLLGWDNPSTDSGLGDIHRAERDFVEYIRHDPFPPWANVFVDAQLHGAIDGVRRLFITNPGIAYEPIKGGTVATLVERLRNALPPIIEEFDADGNPNLGRVDISHALYSGWVYWLGRGGLRNRHDLSFLDTNRLCNHAILQQCAINEALDAGIR